MLQNIMSRNLQQLENRLIWQVRLNFSDSKEPELTTENAHKVIDKWVKNNKICLFMKGTPVSPQCGYSNFVVELLKKYGITEYKSINVLKDNIVREQVKIYSKWPTYPQLFIDGELVGGCDILHEMHKEQSLETLLQEKGLI